MSRSSWRARAGSRFDSVAPLVVVVAVAPVLVAGLIVGLVAATLGAGVVRPSSLLERLAMGVDVDLERAVTRSFSRPSVVVAADGTVIGRFRAAELYEPLGPDEVPKTVEAAVVAAEDRRFWSHLGFDGRSAVRALVANLTRGEVDQGASTITQQLAKNLFTGADKTMRRKLEELQHAVALEARYTKRQILAAYLSTAYFGENAFGIGAAARTYFGKPASGLSLSEAALLVGVVPAPSRYNPRHDPELAERRRLLVLDRVAEVGFFPVEEVDQAREEQPRVLGRRASVEAYPYFLDYTRRWLLEVLGVDPRALYQGGLRIETTLDRAIQEHARRTVRAHLGAPDQPAAAVVVLDPRTGEVRAMVGSRDWQESQVNLALGGDGGGTGRQPGSAFKPLVLAAAFENGARPDDEVEAPAEYVPTGFEEPVRNYTRRGYGTVTLAEAIRRSINTSFVILTERVEPATVADLGRRLGLDDLPDPSSVGRSIGIGTYEVSPLALTAAYAAFANGGHRVDPRPVRRVLGPDGDPLERPLPPAVGEQVLSAATAARVTDALAGVIEAGTGTRARLDRPAAGKTGTSNEAADAWFVGYTPQLVSGVWVGHPDAVRPMRDIAGFEEVTGGTLPALLWREVMAAAVEGLPVEEFPAAPDSPPPTTTPAPRPTTTTTPRPTTTTTRRPATTTTPRPTTTTTTTNPGAPATTAPSPATTTTPRPASTTTTTTAPTTTTTTTTAPTTTTTPPPATTAPTTTTTPPPATTTTTTTSTTTTTTTAPAPTTTTAPT